MITAALALAMLAAPVDGNAGSFNPDQASILRIAHRFKATLDASGILGVGRDVLTCYMKNLHNPDGLKLCVVYDWAALTFDRQMMQFFTGAGAPNVRPAPMFTNQAIDARMHTYGALAFQGDQQAMRMVGNAATRVLKAMPGPARSQASGGDAGK